MVDTKAKGTLNAYFESADAKSHSWLARQLGLKQPSVSAWLRGISRPETHHRRALTRVMATVGVKVPEDDWMTDDERATANGTTATAKRRSKKAA